MLNFTLTFAPMSLFMWQLYAAQVMRNKWTSYFGDDMMSDNDEDQDVLKVRRLCSQGEEVMVSR